MKIVKLDGRMFTNQKVFHEILKERLDFPDFYGKNASALWDCLTGFIGPVKIEWEFFEDSKKNLGTYAELMLNIFQDAQKEMPGEFFIVVK